MAEEKVQLWDIVSSEKFHEAVRSLRRLTDQPSEEHSYRISSPRQSEAHTMKAEHELQLADDFAFIANRQEGVENVTATTVQETADGITVLLASNHTPSNDTLCELNKIASLLRDCINKGEIRAYLPIPRISHVQEMGGRSYLMNYSIKLWTFVKIES